MPNDQYSYTGSNPPAGWVAGTSQVGHPTYYNPAFPVPELSGMNYATTPARGTIPFNYSGMSSGGSSPLGPLSPGGVPLSAYLPGGATPIYSGGQVGSMVNGQFQSYAQQAQNAANNQGPATGFMSGVSGGTPTTGGNLIGTGVSHYDPVSGGIPSVPSPIGTQGGAITGNLGNLGSLENLAGQTNQFNQQQLLAALGAGLPQYNSMVNQASGNILNNLQGVIPQDVQNVIAQQAAERGVAIGSPGSPNANSAMLRALGLTSLDLQNLGQNQLTQAINRTPIAHQFDPSSFFVTPQQMQDAQWWANMLASSPIPSAARNAAMRALQQGMNQGNQGGGSPWAGDPSGNPIQAIINRYAPTATGQQPTGNPNAPYSTDTTDYYVDPNLNISDPSLYGLTPDPNSYYVDPSLGPESYYAPSPTNLAPTDLGTFDPNYDPFAGYAAFGG